MNCKGPIRPLLMMRGTNMTGTFFQPTAPGVCVHTSGNYFDVGGPGSGPQPDSAFVFDETTIKVTFGDCIATTGVTPYGITLFVSSDNGGTWSKPAILVSVTTPVMTINVLGDPIQPGDLVRVVYTAPGINDCEDGEPIADFNIPVDNPLELAGDHVLLESGGTKIVLVEADTDGTDTVTLETAT
jgi:hypothetical protein